jgi:CRISPR-associated protein Cas5h
MQSLSFTVEAPLFYTFRVPSSTSIIRSFAVPPFTTIRGMLSNAMGLKRDDFLLQDTDLRIGLNIVRQPERNIETARMLKYVARNETEAPLRRVFPSSPMTKEFLFWPEYRIHLIENTDVLSRVSQALKDPSRPLYLGQSDDFAIVSELQISEAVESISDSVDSIVEGVHPNCEIIRLPYKYNFANGSVSLVYRTFSLPSTYPIQLKKKAQCYRVGQKYVAFY